MADLDVSLESKADEKLITLSEEPKPKTEDEQSKTPEPGSVEQKKISEGKGEPASQDSPKADLNPRQDDSAKYAPTWKLNRAYRLQKKAQAQLAEEREHRLKLEERLAALEKPVKPVDPDEFLQDPGANVRRLLQEEKQKEQVAAEQASRAKKMEEERASELQQDAVNYVLKHPAVISGGMKAQQEIAQILPTITQKDVGPEGDLVDMAELAVERWVSQQQAKSVEMEKKKEAAAGTKSVSVSGKTWTVEQLNDLAKNDPVAFRRLKPHLYKMLGEK